MKIDWDNEQLMEVQVFKTAFYRSESNVILYQGNRTFDWSSGMNLIENEFKSSYSITS